MLNLLPPDMLCNTAQKSTAFTSGRICFLTYQPPPQPPQQPEGQQQHQQQQEEELQRQLNSQLQSIVEAAEGVLQAAQYILQSALSLDRSGCETVRDKHVLRDVLVYTGI